jgi:hypothetical protein
MMTEKHHEHETALDRTLWRWWPDGTIVRRFLLLAFVSVLVTAVAGGFIIGQVKGNTSAVERSSTRGQQAICAVLLYAEQQSGNIAARADTSPAMQRANLRASAAQLETLAHKMRGTGVRCPPRRPRVHFP